MYGKDWTVESVEAEHGYTVVKLEPPKGGGRSRMPAS